MLPRTRNDEQHEAGADAAGAQVQQIHGGEGQADTFTFSLKHRFILTTALLVLIFLGVLILALVFGSL